MNEYKTIWNKDFMFEVGTGSCFILLIFEFELLGQWQTSLFIELDLLS